MLSQHFCPAEAKEQFLCLYIFIHHRRGTATSSIYIGAFLFYSTSMELAFLQLHPSAKFPCECTQIPLLQSILH